MVQLPGGRFVGYLVTFGRLFICSGSPFVRLRVPRCRLHRSGGSPFFLVWLFGVVVVRSFVCSLISPSVTVVPRSTFWFVTFVGLDLRSFTFVHVLLLIVLFWLVLLRFRLFVRVYVVYPLVCLRLRCVCSIRLVSRSVGCPTFTVSRCSPVVPFITLLLLVVRCCWRYAYGLGAFGFTFTLLFTLLLLLFVRCYVVRLFTFYVYRCYYVSCSLFSFVPHVVVDFAFVFTVLFRLFLRCCSLFVYLVVIYVVWLFAISTFRLIYVTLFVRFVTFVSFRSLRCSVCYLRCPRSRCYVRFRYTTFYPFRYLFFVRAVITFVFVRCFPRLRLLFRCVFVRLFPFRSRWLVVLPFLVVVLRLLFSLFVRCSLLFVPCYVWFTFRLRYVPFVDCSVHVRVPFVPVLPFVYVLRSFAVRVYVALLRLVRSVAFTVRRFTFVGCVAITTALRLRFPFTVTLPFPLVYVRSLLFVGSTFTVSLLFTFTVYVVDF